MRYAFRRRYWTGERGHATGVTADPPDVSFAVAGCQCQGEQCTCEKVRVDIVERSARVGQRKIKLTSSEARLLQALGDRPGVVVTHEQLMREVWGTAWWGTTRTLDLHVEWLRRKLGDDESRPRYIETIRGIGYRFTSQEAAPDV